MIIYKMATSTIRVRKSSLRVLASLSEIWREERIEMRSSII